MSLAAFLKQRLGVDSELVRGSGGIFDVAVDGDIVFSKHQEGDFPEHELVLQRLESRGP